MVYWSITERKGTRMDRLKRAVLLLLLFVLPVCCIRTGTDSRTEQAEEAAASPDPTPDPTRAPTAAPTAAPRATPVPTPEPTPEPTPFGLVWLPDTQALISGDGELLYQLDLLGEEINARIVPDHLIAVLHTGDIVDTGGRTQQWEIIGRFVDTFIDRIPFYAVSGNHDISKYDIHGEGSYWAYLRQPFLQRLPEGQTFEGGKMFYVVLNEGERPLLLLGIGYDMAKTRAELDWIDETMQAHADMPCILMTHAYQNRPGAVLWYCSRLEEQVVSRYPNIRLVLCGHARGFFHSVKTYDDDGDGTEERTVHILMLNEQNGRYLYRVLSVDMLHNAVAVRTYAIGSDEPIPDDPDFHEPADFTIENIF